MRYTILLNVLTFIDVSNVVYNIKFMTYKTLRSINQTPAEVYMNRQSYP